MTNLQRWLFYASLFAAPYFAVIFGAIQSQFLSERMFQVQILPIIFLVLFGLYAATTVLYRVFTFNDCPAAAAELQDQIKEARADLATKGLKLKE